VLYGNDPLLIDCGDDSSDMISLCPPGIDVSGRGISIGPLQVWRADLLGAC